MRLTNARVFNYKCVDDTEEFTLENITCFVGKNEAGKTALLQALHRFKPDRAATVDRVRDYPRRRLSNYESVHASEPAQMLWTKWLLAAPDTAALEAIIGPAAKKVTAVEVTSRYPATTKPGVPGQTWSLSVDDAAVVSHLLGGSGLTQGDRETIGSHATIASLKQAVASPQNERIAALKSILDTHFKRGTASLAAIDCLSGLIPHFVYFSQYDAMRGRMALEQLQAKVNQGTALEAHEQLFLDFCAFAGSSLNELANITSFEALKAKFEAAQTTITDQIFEYWTSNNHLSVEFSRDQGLAGDPAPFNQGSVFNIRIKNALHGNTVPFDDRSTGFVWFFSFLVLFSRVKQRYGDNVILLLDEPGLNLHAQAQGDLLRFFKERLAPHHQVIYTTHSLFMVPPQDLLSVRIVEDVVVERPKKKPEVFGTKVRTDVLKVTEETLFPLQGALGFEITQTLFVGANTLIVEGPSELLYFEAYSQALRAAGRTGLDPRWTVCPVGGITKVPAFMALFGSKLKIAVVLDLAAGDKGKVADAKKLSEDLLRQGRVFTFAEFTGKQESDVEDMLGDDGYRELVDKTYQLSPVLSAPTKAPARIVKWVEEQMRLRPAAPDFGHFGPAEHLLVNRSSLLTALPGAADALDRFEALFKKLNGVL